MRSSRRTVSIKTGAAAPAVPPQPLSATGPPTAVIITFDQAMDTSPLPSHANFFVRQGSGEYTGAGPPSWPTDFTLLLPRTFLGFNAGPDVVEYFAAPQELFGQNGLPVAPFVLPFP